MNDELKNNSALSTQHSALAEGAAAKGQFLVYEAEDGKVKIDVRLEDETVWLTQQLMAELFQTPSRTSASIFNHIYEEGELHPRQLSRNT